MLCNRRYRGVCGHEWDLTDDEAVALRPGEQGPACPHCAAGFWPSHGCVQWSEVNDPASWSVDDGSAAHEPESAAALGYTITRDSLATAMRGEINRQAGEISDLQACHNDLVTELRRMQGENDRLRALLNCVDDDATVQPTPSPDVKGDIERTIDHLLNGRTTADQRRGLSTATERAGRVKAGTDEALGRALR